MIQFKNQFNDYVKIFNNHLDKFLNDLKLDSPSVLRDAITYSVVDGGKRIRPILCLATAEMLGLNQEDVIDYALTIELIHAYSLVHDDLECMDNDDFRRGKLSTHKKYGEAIGVLTGDALLNLAIEKGLEKAKDINDIKVLKLIFDYAGYSGMIAGQVYDINSASLSSLEELLKINTNKTAKLITAPLLVSSIKAGAKYYEELKTFGFNIGVLFQIVDDIMDEESSFDVMGKTPNKDKEENKLTFVKLFGLEGAKEQSKNYYQKALDSIKLIPNHDFLVELTHYMFNRRS